MSGPEPVAPAPGGQRTEWTVIGSWRDFGVGAVMAAGDAMAGALAGARRLTGSVRATGTRVAGRGRDGQDGARRQVTGAVTAVADVVARSTVVTRVVDVQLDRVLRPLVSVVLDDVLGRLEGDPDRIRTLIRGQRDSLIDDVVERIRVGALAGDATVDRITARLLRRTPDVPGPHPPPRARPR
jgi:hypothetical protein